MNLFFPHRVHVLPLLFFRVYFPVCPADTATCTSDYVLANQDMSKWGGFLTTDSAYLTRLATSLLNSDYTYAFRVCQTH